MIARRAFPTSMPLPGSAEGGRLVIGGAMERRLFVLAVRGSTVVLIRPSLVDWALGRVFGWWR